MEKVDWGERNHNRWILEMDPEEKNSVFILLYIAKPELEYED